MYATTIYFLYPVVNVSAQGQCTVTVRNPNSLTTTGGALANGTTNVRYHCSCQRGDGTVLNARWYDPNGARLDPLGISNANVPHFVLESNNTEAVLVIPTFTGRYAGTYTCARNDPPNPPPPTATITLTICKLIICAVNYFYLVLHSLKTSIVSIVILVEFILKSIVCMVCLGTIQYYRVYIASC